MKHILSILFSIILINSCVGQNKNKKPIPVFYSVCEPSKLEYVIFCGIKLKVPRPKNDSSGSNCCQGDSSKNSSNLRCDNGGIIIWTYYPNEKTARIAFEKYLRSFYSNKGILDVQQNPITCYLLNKRVKGYKLRLKLEAVTSSVGSSKRDKTTMIQHILAAYGVINGRHVIVELQSDKLNNNKDIVKTMRQIIHF